MHEREAEVVIGNKLGNLGNPWMDVVVDERVKEKQRWDSFK